MSDLHLIPDPDRGPDQFLDAVALAQGRVHVYALRPGMSFADFEAEMVTAHRLAEEEAKVPPRDIAAELDVALSRIAALEAAKEQGAKP